MFEKEIILEEQLAARASSSVARAENCRPMLALWIIEGLLVDQDVCALQGAGGTLTWVSGLGRPMSVNADCFSHPLNWAGSISVRGESYVEIGQRIAVILCLGIGLASSGLTVAQSSPRLGQQMSQADREPPGLHDVY